MRGCLLRFVWAIAVTAAVGTAFADELAPPTRPSPEKTVEAESSCRIKIGKDTTVISEPLTEDGYVDYLAWFDRELRRGVTREDNAAILLWQAYGPRFDDCLLTKDVESRKKSLERLDLDLPVDGEYFVSIDDTEESSEFDREVLAKQVAAVRGPWTPDQYPQLAEWLQANEAPLDLVRRASLRKKMYQPPVVNFDGFFRLVLMDQDFTWPAKSVCEALQLRALRRAGEGDIEWAVQELLAIHRLARLHDRASSVTSIHAVHMHLLAFQAEVELIRARRLDENQLRQLIEKLPQLTPIADARESMNEFQRFLYLDTITQLARDELLLHEITELAPYEKYLGSFDLNEALRYGNGCFDRLVAALDKPTYAEQRDTLDQISREIEEAVKKRRGLKNTVSLFLVPREERSKLMGIIIGEIVMMHAAPTTTNARFIEYRHQLSSHLVRLTAALELYRQRHGAYPEDLKRILPDIAEAIPVDRLSGKPLVYRRTDAGYDLYGLGSDGKDGGGQDVGNGRPDVTAPCLTRPTD